MSPIVIALTVFFGVAALVGGAALSLGGKSGNRLEDRLELLTGLGGSGSKEGLLKDGASSVLTRPLDEVPSLFERLFERFGNLSRVFEQADTTLSVSKLALICAGMAAAGVCLALVLRIHAVLVPLVAVSLGAVPVGWLLFRRKRRLKAFGAQLPDALEMLGRSLRAGQSLAFGFSMVSSEMSAPIGREFGRVFEEQNLGIPLEESLESMCERVPNLDLEFFMTAVILQRQTGGDLAEILDKIGSLIRDRFRIWGQIQALTGEGRLSGIVLLALPFVLFLAVYQFNRDYVMLLFTDPMGKKMLAVAIVMQILGAPVIKKIVNIKV